MDLRESASSPALRDLFRGTRPLNVRFATSPPSWPEGHTEVGRRRASSSGAWPCSPAWIEVSCICGTPQAPADAFSRRCRHTVGSTGSSVARPRRASRRARSAPVSRCLASLPAALAYQRAVTASSAGPRRLSGVPAQPRTESRCDRTPVQRRKPSTDSLHMHMWKTCGRSAPKADDLSVPLRNSSTSRRRSAGVRRWRTAARSPSAASVGGVRENLRGIVSPPLWTRLERRPAGSGRLLT